MNHGAMVAIHGAARAAAERKAMARVLDAFRVRGATAPERARPLAELGLSDGDRVLGQLVRAGVVRGVDARGRVTVLGDDLARPVAHYLDEPAFVAHRDAKTSADSRTAVLIVVAFLLLLLGVALVRMTRG